MRSLKASMGGETCRSVRKRRRKRLHKSIGTGVPGPATDDSSPGVGQNKNRVGKTDSIPLGQFDPFPLGYIERQVYGRFERLFYSICYFRFTSGQFAVFSARPKKFQQNRFALLG